MQQGNADETLDNSELHPLFWDTIPEGAEDNSAYAALQAVNTESTSEELAANYKEQGNGKLKTGVKAKNKLLLRDAADFYKKGLALDACDKQLNAQLSSNLAHVESLLGNWRSALSASQNAISFDPGNIKSYYRGARAAAKLNEFSAAVQLCQQGLRIESDADELHKLLHEVRKTQNEKEAQKAKQKKETEDRIVPLRSLVCAIFERRYKVTRPQVAVGDRKPYVDSEGLMHWPVMFLYPETMQQDVVEDFCELDTFSAHLDQMFSPDAPPLPWDMACRYTREAVALYFLTNAGKPLDMEQLLEALQGRWPHETYKDRDLTEYGPQASEWSSIDEKDTLQHVLTLNEYIIPGVPLFFILVKGSTYENQFLSKTKL